MFDIIDKRNAWNQSHESIGRENHKVEMIVIHGMALTDGDLVPKIWNDRAASTHYGIKNNDIEMYVLPTDTAWNCGNWNINLRTIAVEHLNSTGAPEWAFSEETLATSVKFIAYLLKKYHLTVNDIHMHKEFKVTTCPQSLAEDDNWKKYLSRIAKLTGDKLNISKKLTPDGILSNDLIEMMEQIFKLPKTGIIHSQPISNRQLFNGNDKGIEFLSNDQAKGAKVVSILQKRLGIKEDGFWGSETMRALQKRYDFSTTGYINNPDPLIISLAGQMNTGVEDFIRKL